MYCAPTFSRRHTSQVPHTSGFTLIELLTIIAVIGILASVVTVGLSGVRARATLKSNMSLLENVRAGAAQCLFKDRALNAPVPNDVICTGATLRWPTLSGGWVYGTMNSDVNTLTFTIVATRDAQTITCTNKECTSS
jgi:prepilin-type N-terminal cleavage/methylation domain-containing protein